MDNSPENFLSLYFFLIIERGSYTTLSLFSYTYSSWTAEVISTKFGTVIVTNYGKDKSEMVQIGL
jgi:hypothetical protein